MVFFIEKQTTVNENKRRLMTMQHKIVGIEVLLIMPFLRLKSFVKGLVQPHRNLVREGELEVWSENTKEMKKRVLLLFNDVLIETKQLKQDSLQFKRAVELSAVAPVALDYSTHYELAY